MTTASTGLDVTEDIDGNVIIPPAPTSEVAQLIYLLEWARLRQFQIGPMIRLGSLTVQVADLRIEERRDAVPVDIGPWAAAGHTED